VEQKRVGNLQIEIGWVLVIVSILVGSIGSYIMIDSLRRVFSILSETWKYIADSKVIQRELIVANVVSYSSLYSIVFLIGIVLLSVLSLLLLTIAIIFITQGTANLNIGKNIKEEQLDINEAKRKFKHAFRLAFIVVLIGSFLFFKPVFDLRDMVLSLVVGCKS